MRTLVKGARQTGILCFALLTPTVFSTQTYASPVPSFTGLGTLGGSYSMAFGVSADGSVVVGRSTTPYTDGDQAFRWTAAAGMVSLGALPVPSPLSDARAVSGNGQVIVGLVKDSASTFAPARWSATSGWESLVSLPGNISAPFAYAASRDGSVIAGEVDGYAFRWTAEQGFHYLSSDYGSASAITPDGYTIVGRIGRSEAFRWTQAGGFLRLGYLPGGDVSIAYGVSSDATAICGLSSTSPTSGGEAFLWTESAGMIGLGSLPGSSGVSAARAVSGKGDLVVGYSGSEAFIWDAANGMQNLKTLLTNTFQLDLSGWTLKAAFAISEDGSTIVGRGTNPSGMEEGWVAVIPEPSVTLLVPMGFAVLRIRRFRQRSLQPATGRTNSRFSNTDQEPLANTGISRGTRRK